MENSLQWKYFEVKKICYLVSFHIYFSVKKMKGIKQFLQDNGGMKNKLLAGLLEYCQIKKY